MKTARLLDQEEYSRTQVGPVAGSFRCQPTDVTRTYPTTRIRGRHRGWTRSWTPPLAEKLEESRLLSAQPTIRLRYLSIWRLCSAVVDREPSALYMSRVFHRKPLDPWGGSSMLMCSEKDMRRPTPVAALWRRLWVCGRPGDRYRSERSHEARDPGIFPPPHLTACYTQRRK